MIILLFYKMTDTYNYSVKATVQSNYVPLWTGTYEKLNLGTRRFVISELGIALANHVASKRGGIYFSDGKRNNVTGKVVANGKNWTFTFSNYGYSFKSESGEELKGGYMDTLLKQLSDDPSKIEFEELQGNVYIYPFGSAPTSTPTHNSTLEPTQTTQNATEAEGESDSDGEDDFDLFG